MTNSPSLSITRQQHPQLEHSEDLKPNQSQDERQATISEESMTTYELNKSGCASVQMGNYTEANCLFQLALKKQLTRAQSLSSPLSFRHDGDDISDLDDSDDVDDSRISSSGDDIEDDQTDSSEASGPINENDDSSFDGSSIVTGDSRSNAYLTNTPDHRNAQRMTTSSKLRISSFSGQHNNYQRNRHLVGACSVTKENRYHEVYCMPIELTKSEWESTSLDDKTFVLVFNSALCNHLWGMEIQEQESTNACQVKRQAEQQEQTSQMAFVVANELYHLALGNASNSGRIIGINPRNGDAQINRNVIFDSRLYLLAILNNLSHIYKTVGGDISDDSLKYDRMLLKAIFWWRDVREQLRRHGGDNDGDNYDEKNDEIVEIFLEHVFYLIGAPGSVVPAAAA